MARHHRRYGGIVSFGNLPLVNDSVKGMDVLVGAGVGFIASTLVKAALQKVLPGDAYAKLTTTVGKLLPLLTGISAGAALYYAQKKSARGAGHAIGAIALGVGMTVSQYLSGQTIAGVKFEAAPVALDLSGYGGLLVDDNSGPAMNGLIVSDHSDQLNQLGAMSLGEDGGDYADVVELSRVG